MPGVRDLLPNYARAIAFARHIREDLDKEYKKMMLHIIVQPKRVHIIIRCTQQRCLYRQKKRIIKHLG